MQQTTVASQPIARQLGENYLPSLSEPSSAIALSTTFTDARTGTCGSVLREQKTPAGATPSFAAHAHVCARIEQTDCSWRTLGSQEDSETALFRYNMAELGTEESHEAFLIQLQLHSQPNSQISHLGYLRQLYGQPASSLGSTYFLCCSRVQCSRRLLQAAT